MERFDLGSTRPDAAQIAKAERDLQIGFRMPTTGEQPALFSGAIDGTGPILEHDADEPTHRSRTSRRPPADPTPVDATTDEDPNDDDTGVEPEEPRIDYD